MTLSFSLTDFTFVLDFRQLKTSVFGWNLCFSSTLNFLIAYFSCNDDLVSKIRDHFPNVNYLKLPNWCLDSIIGPCRRSYYQSCQVVIRNEREILNVVTSKAPKVASRPAGGLGCCKRLSGVRGGAPEKNCD